MSSTRSEEHSEEEIEEMPINPMVESQLNQFQLTDEDVKILLKHHDRWQATKGKDMTSIAVEAYDKILAARSDLEMGNSKEGKQQQKLIREVSGCLINVPAE
jgi:hypothetical protein